MRVTVNGSGAILTHGDSLSGAGVIEFPVNERPGFPSGYTVTGSSPSRKLLFQGHEVATEENASAQTGGGSFDGGDGTLRVTQETGTLLTPLRVVPAADQVGQGNTMIVVVAPGGDPDADFGIFEVTEDARLLVGPGTGAYPFQVNNGTVTARRATVKSISAQVFTFTARSGSGDTPAGDLASLFMFSDGTLAYYGTDNTSAFEVRPDGTVHIKTGTSIVADL
jgi:hypothetical protein